MRKFFLLLGISLLVGLSPLARAERLRVVSDDWAPYIYQEDGQPKGSHVEIANEVFKRLGVEVEWVFMPWKRCLAMVEQGQADGIMGLFKLPAREAFVVYADEPLSRVEFVLFQAHVRPHRVTRLEDLAGLTVGVSSGYDYGPAFNEASYFHREAGPTHAANLGKLALGRVDLVVTDRHVGRYLLHRLGLDQQIEPLPLVIGDPPQFLGLSRKLGHQQVAERFTAALQAFKREPAYGEILARYADQAPSDAAPAQVHSLPAAPELEADGPRSGERSPLSVRR